MTSDFLLYRPSRLYLKFAAVSYLLIGLVACRLDDQASLPGFFLFAVARFMTSYPFFALGGQVGNCTSGTFLVSILVVGMGAAIFVGLTLININRRFVWALYIVAGFAILLTVFELFSTLGTQRVFSGILSLVNSCLLVLAVAQVARRRDPPELTSSTNMLC
jgi:hypothetical protein